MNPTTIISHCEIDAYRAWTDRHAAPAYMRGLPTWVWRQSTTSRGRRRRELT